MLALNAKGFILSGGPASVYEAGAPTLPGYVLESGLPVLGICYGMQLLTHALGGRVASSQEREYGPAQIETLCANPLMPDGSQPVWMSHGDRIEALPPGFQPPGDQQQQPLRRDGRPARAAALACSSTPKCTIPRAGRKSCAALWWRCAAPRQIGRPNRSSPRALSGSASRWAAQPVLAAVSGGVDSSVATALVHRAVGDQLAAVFVDTGMLRQDEREQVETAFRQNLGVAAGHGQRRRRVPR